MTSIDKLSKSFEFLRIPVQLYDSEQRKQDVTQIAKKDKITHLNLIFENITSSNVRQAEEYIKMVSLSVEAYLNYFDDEDRDVYLVADECLNKTIKTLLDSNLIRLQYDLYRFIRKNGPERSLNGALTRFAELSHLIKTHKCRMFVEFLIKENTLSKIASRQEESIQSALPNAMTKICSAFCWSMTDNEVKMLIQSFLPNLSNESSQSTFRRVAANCLSIICLYSRSPYSFYNYLQEELLKLILPLENHKNLFTMWGVLICLRYMVLNLSELDKSSLSASSSLSANTNFAQLMSSVSSTLPTSPSFSSPSKSYSSIPLSNSAYKFTNASTKTSLNHFNIINLCEIYELCMYVLNSPDNRIVTSSLECLQVLFKYLPFKFNIFLTSIGAMNESFIIKKQLSFMNQITEYTNQENLENDSEPTPLNLIENNRPFVTPTHLIGNFYSQFHAPIDFFIRFLAFKFLLNTEGNGSMTIENQNSIEFRLAKLKPDSQVKVLLKTIAFECCANSVVNSPHLMLYSLYYDNEQEMQRIRVNKFNSMDNELDSDTDFTGDEKINSDTADEEVNKLKESKDLFIYDLVNYVHHHDDKMKMNACMLIGQMIQSVLTENNGNYEMWLQKKVKLYFPRQIGRKNKGLEESGSQASNAYNMLRLEILLDYLMRFVKFDNQKVTNNMCKRSALSSLHSCLPTLMQTKYASYSLEILINLIHLRHSTYNLVKCELVDLISSIDFKVVNYIENLLPGDAVLLSKKKNIGTNDLTENFEEDDNSLIDTESKYKSSEYSMNQFLVKNTQERIIEDVFLYLLGSEDNKVRLETAKSLARFVSNMDFYDTASTANHNVLLSETESLLKNGGYSANIFNSSLAENDSCNLNSMSFLFNNSNTNGGVSAGSSSSRSGSFNATTNILYPQKQIRYCCSPLSSVSFNTSVPWISKQNSVINNTFIQPFQSLIKYWPASATLSNSINALINRKIEQNLNYLIPKLTKTLLISNDKNQFFGCLEAIDFIFQTYSPAIFYSSSISATNMAVDVNDHHQIYELLELMISLFKHPLIAFDIYANNILMRLIGELYCSYSWLTMKKYDKLIQQLKLSLSNTASTMNTGTVNSLMNILQNSINNVPLVHSMVEHTTGLSYSYLQAFNNNFLKHAIDRLFLHLMRMLCLLSCVIDESALPVSLVTNLSAGSTAVTSTEKSSSLNTTITSSPVMGSDLNSSSPSNLNESKRNTTLKETPLIKTKNQGQSVSQGTTDKSNTGSLPRTSSTSSLPKTSQNIYLGYFQNSSVYLKLYETVKVSYNSYKKSPKVSIHDRFLQLVKSTLGLFAQLLEAGLGVHELGPHLDEILLYLKIIFAIDPSSSVKCVTMSLKALFSLNLSGLMFEYIQQQLNFVNNNASSNSSTGKNQYSSNADLNTAPLASQLSAQLSTSLTSINSYSQSSIGTLKKNQTSILSKIVLNQLNQFTRFMFSQTMMFKSDSLMNQIHLNHPAMNQYLGKDSDQRQSNLASHSSSTTSINSLTNQSKNFDTTSISSNTSTGTSSTIASGTPKSSNFASNIFNLLRKGSKQDSAPAVPVNPQQQQKEMQQKRLKQQKTDTKTITQYIKSFESIVIKSLRQYTFTTSVNLQSRILELLVQLIFLKVDYCLLDSDKVFIEYVLKQFDHLEQKRGSDGGMSRSASRLGGNVSHLYESNSTLSNFDLLTLDENGSGLLANSYAVDLYESFDSESEFSDPLNPFDSDTMLNKLCVRINIGQLNNSSAAPISSNLSLRQQEHQRNHILIPKLFDFLILLSHEKKQSNTQSTTKKSNKSSYKSGNGLLTVPEVMQLCDNLIASENSPHTHALPALRPLVIDLFLNRTSEDTKELDMQHDVIIKCMLRLIHYPQVWPLLTIAILKYKKDNEEKWKKVSRQICDSLFDSMRSSHFSNNQLKYREFNGNEMRAVRRYSRSNVSWIESLKQLFLLLNCLAPQAFRPIDFILLSLFEISRSHILSKRSLTINEMNNWLCALMVHIYLLLSHSTEEQILIRLHHLMSEITNTYENLESDTNFANRFRGDSDASCNSRFPTDSSSDSDVETSSASSRTKLSNEMKNQKSAAEKNKIYFDSIPDGLEYNEDNSEFDLNESAVYFSKFLLKSLEKIFTSMIPLCKFNAFQLFSSNLSATSSSTLPRDYQINTYRDLNHTQHLLSNYLLFMMYILNSGNFTKIGIGMSSLVNNRITPFRTKHSQTDESAERDVNIPNQSQSASTSPTMKSPDKNTDEAFNKIYDFGLEQSQFAYKINRLILFKLSKSNPFISSMWQYFLILCNYQDTEYWSSSFVRNFNIRSVLSSPTGYEKLNAELGSEHESNSSTTNNSLNPSLQQGNDFEWKLKTELKSELMYSLKHRICLKENYLRSPLYELIVSRPHIQHSTLSEQLFRFVSITAYCDLISTRQQLDNSTGLTMLLMNNLVDLFELATHEPSVLDLFSTIHRNASASSLFIHCINSSWNQIYSRRKLNLLFACLKSLEGVHLGSSGHLLNLLIDKFFDIPYLSLVRYADHIACQRVEMMIEPTKSDLVNQLSQQHMSNLNKFFSDFRYSFRHKRLISLLEQLQNSLSNDLNENEHDSLTTSKQSETKLKTSPSVDFFMLYIESDGESNFSNLDKEWYYNIVRSACSYTSPEDNSESNLLSDNSSLKSKQCALMLSNLDYSNAITILAASSFKLTILKDCILLGAKRTQSTIQKLPYAFKQATTSVNIERDFMHPIWLASTRLLFDLLNDLCPQLPNPPLITLNNISSGDGSVNLSACLIYESKLNELSEKYDFYSFIAPITEAINAYLKCLHQYPSLLNQLTDSNTLASVHADSSSKSTTNTEKINDLITYVIFQMGFVNFISSKKHSILTLHSLNESFLCFFNLLINQKLLQTFCQRTNYSTLVSSVIKDFYQLIMAYFFKLGDENIIHTPILSSEHNIDYSLGQNATNDVLFNTTTFDIMLKLRFLITNYRWQSSSSSETGASDSNNSSSMNTSYIISSNTHRFLQHQSHYFKQKLPFNMRDLIEKIFSSICRLPIIDRFIRIPDVLWRSPGFKLEYSQLLNSDSSTLPPLDYLRDPVILKEHLKHILNVGWTSRTQFEYEYVNMLTLLHNLSEDYYPPAEGQSLNGCVSEMNTQVLPSEEIKERNKCICLVVKGLSSWLIKSTLTPKSGSSLNSLYEQVSRNKVPQFLHTQLGQQYGDVKRTIESLNRNNLFTNLNSTSIANNINLLHMLDPTLIDEIDRNRQQLMAQLMNENPAIRRLDYTQSQSIADSLANLMQISMNISQRDHNLPFSSNIERMMICDLATNTDTYFYYGQISLEGLLKFLGLWNKNYTENKQQPNSIATSISNFVSGNTTQAPSTLTVVDEVQNKTVNAFNNFIKVLTDDNPDVDQTYQLANSNSVSSAIDTSLTEDDLRHSSNNRQEEAHVQQDLYYNRLEDANVSQIIQRSFNRNNLDVISVLRTVLDYYESFFRHPCLQLKLEIFRSMLYLSNTLFESKHQYESLMTKMHVNFEWLDSFIHQDNDESMLMPCVNELIDESLLGLGIYGDALSRCCLQTSKNDFSFNMSTKDLERLNKLFENGFKSNSLAIKISTAQGLMYWLESIALGYFVNNNDAKGIIDHLCKQISQMKDMNTFLLTNSRYISTLWSAGFYAIENCLDSIRDAQQFINTFIKQTYAILNDPNTPYFLFYQLYMGLERFLLSSMIPSGEINTIQKLLNLKFNDEQRSLCLTSLTITSLYASNRSKQMNYWNDIIKHNKPVRPTLSFSSAFDLNDMLMENISVNQFRSNNQQDSREIPKSESIVLGYPQILELSTHPELQANLLKVLEVATSFLDRMKSSSTTKEASVYASLLPKILCDFLPPHDLLNKLITEFLNSSQHPYPEAVAYILYKCFELLQEKGLQSQIQEWCLLSLTSFLQRTSIYESIWLSSCLLVSATKNQWLKATFPFLLNRYCSFETIDRAIFYMSVIEFRKQFKDASQLQSICSILESVARPGTPYAELINLINIKNNTKQ